MGVKYLPRREESVQCRCFVNLYAPSNSVVLTLSRERVGLLGTIVGQESLHQVHLKGKNYNRDTLWDTLQQMVRLFEGVSQNLCYQCRENLAIPQTDTCFRCVSTLHYVWQAKRWDERCSPGTIQTYQLSGIYGGIKEKMASGKTEL